MHTFNNIISYILSKNYNFSSAVIIAINNQTQMISLKLILNKNRVLLSFKHMYMSTKLIKHEINIVLLVY